MVRRSMKAWLALFALALGACTQADGDAPADLDAVPGCEGASHAPCAVTDSACQARIWHLVRCVRRSPAEARPTVHTITRGQFAELVTDDNAEPHPHTTRPVALMLERLGMVDNANTYLREVQDAGLVFPAGAYHRETHEVWLIDPDPTELDASWMNLLLAHEMVHAQQAQEHDYSEAFDGPITSYDANLAARAVIEGEADLYEMLVAPSYLGFRADEMDFDSWFDAVVAAADSTFDDPLRFLYVPTWFPYAYGSRLMWTVHRQGGPDAVSALFYDTPSTLEFMLGEVDLELRGALFDAWPELEPVASYESKYATRWGPRLLELFLHATLTGDAARALALGWRGDALEVFEHTSTIDGVAAVWRVRLASEADASALAEAAAGLPMPSQGSLEVLLSGTDVAIVAAPLIDGPAWFDAAQAGMPQ